MVEPCFSALEAWPGGGGGGVETGICAEAENGEKTSAQSKPAKRKVRVIWIPSGLMAGGVVAGFCVDVERRQSFRRMHLDFNFAPTSIVRFITRPVSQNILIAQLHADFRGDVRQIIQILDGKDSPPGHFRDFRQQRGTVQFFRSAVPVGEWIEYADSVKLGIRFLHQTLDIALVVPAMIISSVG